MLQHHLITHEDIEEAVEQLACSKLTLQNILHFICSPTDRTLTPKQREAVILLLVSAIQGRWPEVANTINQEIKK